MSGNAHQNMPDTTSRMAPYRRSIRRLVASLSLFASSLLLVASMGLAQDGGIGPEGSGSYPPQSEEDSDNGDTDNGGTSEDEFTDEIEDDSNAEDEYDDGSADSGAPVDQTQRPQQTPATGGVALLPLAGSVLAAGFGGFTLLRRR